MIQLLLGAFIFISAPIFMKNRIKVFKIPLTSIYILEAMLLISLWTIVSLPFIYMDMKFDVAVHVYLAVLAGLYLGALVYAVIRKSGKIARNSSYCGEIVQFVKENKSLCAFTVITIGYQILRCMILQTGGYRDSKTYIALINDMVETNRFFLMEDVYGYFGMSLKDVSPKYIFSGWYTFEAFISYVSGLHPLIIVNTVLPPVIMLFAYMSYWVLSELFFGKNSKKRVWFLVFIALIFQFLADDTGVLFMIWPTWGKNLVLSISIPMYLYYYFSKQLDKKVIYAILVLIIFFACFVSTTGVVVMPILIIGCKLYSILINRRIKLVNGLSIIVQFVPVIIYALIYKMW